MATFTKFNKFTYQMGTKCYLLTTDTLKVALTNTAPTAATDTGFLPGSLHPPPAAANGYTSGGHTMTSTGWSETGGVSTLTDTTDITITATAGGIGPFQYAILYDDTTTTPVADPLIGYWNYGSSITLADTESLVIDVTASLFTLT
jgi:hypothetical protein